MTAIADTFIDLAGCSLHVLSCGPEDGLPVILLHGMKFQAETWRELGTLDTLGKAGLRVLALDMPGFGKSAASEVSPSEVLKRLYRQLGLHKAVLIGPSMGGRIALEFAIAQPELIAGLVLVGAVGVEENRADLSKIIAPTLIIWGEDDQVSPLANSDILLAELSRAERQIYPQAPHPCYLQQRERWHQSLTTFFQQLCQ